VLKKILAASCLLVTSMASQATIISHFGYERDSSSDIVKGGGLEWLMWDVTKGKSINQALSDYSGMRLATSAEITNLFNTFRFGNYNGDWEDSIIDQTTWSNWSVSEASPHNKFIALFGVTTSSRTMCSVELTGNCYMPDDPFVGSVAQYGKNNVWSWVSRAGVRDDYTDTLLYGYLKSNRSHEAFLTKRFVDQGNDEVGVALVRMKTEVPAAVNTPASFSLLTLGLIGLGFRRRHTLRR
jgi:hypothetical protein